MSLILEKFLIRNNYTNFSRKDISLQLQTHPQNPSFRAITDTLDYFGIDNVAATVPEDSLPSLPSNFISIVDKNGPQLALVVKKDESVYSYFEDKKREKYTSSDFVKVWSKKIIAIAEAEKKDTRTIILQVLAGLLALTALAAFLFLKDFSWISVLILFLSSIGLYISLLLVSEKIGYHSEAVHSICTLTTNSNCDDVINSKGGMLTKQISLADASFLYFSILVFQIIFFGYSDVISVFILLSLPVIFFSIYYQGIVIKKWCPLCLGVAGLLSLLNIIIFQDLTLNFTILQTLEVIMAMLILVPTYFFVKKLIVKQKSIDEKLIAASSFKRNPDVIKNFMKNANVIDGLDMIQDEVRIGNPEADNKIIAFTNPFCGFCKAAFESYVKIISAYPDVEVWMRFNTDYENIKENSTKISVRLIELYLEEGQERFISAFLNWFDDKNEKDWLKKYGNPKIEEKTISILKEHRSWAIKNSIAHTPATIIGGEEFPSSYGYEDLTLVISDILEFQEEKKDAN